MYVGIYVTVGCSNCLFVYFKSAGDGEWESSCFATTLLHHAPPRGDIGASTICRLWRFISSDWYVGRF